MPRQFKSTDTSQWVEQFGTGKNGSLTITSNKTFKANYDGFTTNANAYASFTGSLAATSGTVTDGYFSYNNFNTSYVEVGDYVLIHQSYGTGNGNWELNVITGGIPTPGGSSTLTLKYPLQNAYITGAQIIKVPQFTSFTLDTSIVLYPQEYNEIYGGIMAFFCNGTTEIKGTIQCSNRGYQAGTTSGGNGYQGDSATNVSTTTSTSNNGAGGGGGGIGDGAAAGGGGGGGNGTAGTTGQPGSRIPGTGGDTDGNASLTDFIFGAGGGGGGFRTGQSGGPGAGGYGGGSIIIFSKNFVQTSGNILANGNDGSASSGSGSHGGGGGGAGGAILIKAITATLNTNLIAANGGSGGNGTGGDGGAGGVGRIHLDYASSYTGTTIPTLDATQDSGLYPAGGSFIYNLI